MTIQNSKLSVHLLTYNGVKYIPYLFDSLRNQTYRDWQFLIMDNASNDGTVEVIKKELENFFQPHQLIENKENIGFAAGHNQMLQLIAGAAPRGQTSAAGAARGLASSAAPLSDYILLLNQDTILAPDYLEKLVLFMDANPKAAAAQGALFRWSHNSTQPPLNLRGGEEGLSDIIDSLGLKVFRNRRVTDWMAGEKIPLNPPFRKGENKECPLPQEVLSLSQRESQRGILTKGEPERDFIEIFGVSGTLPIYRRQALEDVAIDGEVFDEDFFSYKEDVDLAFHLRSAGWEAYLVPEARAWHERSTTLPRGKRGGSINYHSYKNHLLTLLKNEYSANFLRDWPWIVWYEFRKLVYLLFFEPQSLRAWKEIFKLWPKMLEKRRIIKTKRKLFASEMREWFVK